MNNNEAWAAGLLSALGSFTAVNVVRKKKYGYGLYVRLTMRSVHGEMIDRFATSLDLKAREIQVNGSTVKTLSLGGDKLHEIMVRLWPALTQKRKREYADARARMKASKIEPEG